MAKTPNVILHFFFVLVAAAAAAAASPSLRGGAQANGTEAVQSMTCTFTWPTTSWLSGTEYCNQDYSYTYVYYYIDVPELPLLNWAAVWSADSPMLKITTNIQAGGEAKVSLFNRTGGGVMPGFPVSLSGRNVEAPTVTTCPFNSRSCFVSSSDVRCSDCGQSLGYGWLLDEEPWQVTVHNQADLIDVYPSVTVTPVCESGRPMTNTLCSDYGNEPITVVPASTLDDIVYLTGGCTSLSGGSPVCSSGRYATTYSSCSAGSTSCYDCSGGC